MTLETEPVVEPIAAEPPVPQTTETKAIEPPADVPEKFWDPATGTVRVEALLKSYVELERKLGRTVPLPEGPEDREARERLLSALGRPASPDEYQIQARDELVTPDPELNARLHAAGFTQDQVQLVYDLAAERLLPMVASLVEESEAARQVDRLVAHFGGEARWREVARELKTWGQANLEPEVFAALASSHKGILMMHRMMQGGEPELLGRAERGTERLDQQALDLMVRDPRYWRDRDPSFIARVTEGFRSLYGD
ncbi:MAG: hypothetical protein NZ555_00285 [Geminicoccaceae bacterium]|nr:hypothetical protein [Geminicoccaceae bacterium]MDW8370955.1 hypothetical protein [Geminicoccaceae bacterium]